MNNRSIKERMVKSIIATLEQEIATNIENYITEDDVDAFMWNRDYGQELVEAYIEEYHEDLITDYLEMIYDEIDTNDLHSPF